MAAALLLFGFRGLLRWIGLGFLYLFGLVVIFLVIKFLELFFKGRL